MSTVAHTLDGRLGARRRVRLGVPYLVAFAAAAVAAGIGRAVTTTYLPLLLDRIDDAPGLIGAVMLVNAAAGLIVPLVVGLWSDRRQAQGGARRMPFIVGGAFVTAGGLAAVALGSGTSYAVLALAGAVVYIGLNVVTTVHRALVPELFSASERPRATSAQELALLVGGLVGIAVGGALTDLAAWAPFALAAVAMPLLVLPTAARTPEPVSTPEPERESRPLGYYVNAATRPGVRGFLAAQILWVLGYAALPAFFLLYAERELGVRPSVASILLAGFGIATAAAIVLAGRVRNPALQRPLLIAGVALMGGGFVAVAVSSNLIAVGAALLAGATGFGLISTLGFPLFSALIPNGEAGGYSALYFSVRAISSAVALPAAGLIIAATDSYRALFVLGGLATLAALLPLTAGPALARLVRRVRELPFWTAWGASIAALYVTTLGIGVLEHPSGLNVLDERLFRFVNGLGPGHELVWEVLDPHRRNYLILIGIAVAGALLTSRPVLHVFGAVMASAFLSFFLLEGVYALYDRDRPEEVFAPEAISLNGHTWARLESFPSGHMAITAALGVAIAIAFPRLRIPLAGYIAAVAFTRVMFGAHFPLDALMGTILGTASAFAVFAAYRQIVSARATREAPAPYHAAAGTS